MCLCRTATYNIMAHCSNRARKEHTGKGKNPLSISAKKSAKSTELSLLSTTRVVNLKHIQVNYRNNDIICSLYNFFDCIREYSLIYREYQAFSPSYDLAPPPPFPPFFLQQIVSLSQSFCVLMTDLTEGRGGKGAGEKPNHSTAIKSPLDLYETFNTL
jgi:hypothetical protein